MRPRIRTIKPELFKDQKLQRCTRDERLLFIGLIAHADDDGRIEGETALLRSVIFPCDADATNRKVRNWISNLAEKGFIRCYEVAGEPYIDLPKWRDHQRVDKPTPSPLPPFEHRDNPVTSNTTIPRTIQEDSTNGLGGLDDHSCASRAPADRKGKDLTTPPPPLRETAARDLEPLTASDFPLPPRSPR